MTDFGCYIDGSHMSSIDFTIAVIDFAVSRGFEIDEAQYRQDVVDITRHPERLDDETEHEIMNALDWTYDEALDYLNEIDNPAGRYWNVADQSLFSEAFDD